MKKQGIDWNDSLADFKYLLFGPDDPRISQLGVGGYKSAIVKAAAAVAKNIDDVAEEFPRFFKAKTGPKEGKYLLKVPKSFKAKTGEVVTPKNVRAEPFNDVKLTNKVSQYQRKNYDVFEYRPLELKAKMKAGNKAIPKKK